MTDYYVDISDELAGKLKRVDDDKIIESLTELAETETDSDELSSYESVPEIMEDDSLSEAEKKRLKLKAERRSNIPNR